MSESHLAVRGFLGSTVDVRYDTERRVYRCVDCVLAVNGGDQEVGPDMLGSLNPPAMMVVHMNAHAANGDVVPDATLLCLDGDSDHWSDVVDAEAEEVEESTDG